MIYFLAVLLTLTAIFLILLVLVQRGRGGGLAGALGGMGGQSAFGTKAGDLFTRITIGAAAVWILLCVLSVKVFSLPSDKLAADIGSAAPMTETVSPLPGDEPSGDSTGPSEESDRVPPPAERAPVEETK